MCSCDKNIATSIFGLAVSLCMGLHHNAFEGLLYVIRIVRFDRFDRFVHLGFRWEKEKKKNFRSIVVLCLIFLFSFFQIHPNNRVSKIGKWNMFKQCQNLRLYSPSFWIYSQTAGSIDLPNSRDSRCPSVSFLATRSRITLNNIYRSNWFSFYIFKLSTSYEPFSSFEEHETEATSKS